MSTKLEGLSRDTASSGELLTENATGAQKTKSQGKGKSKAHKAYDQDQRTSDRVRINTSIPKGVSAISSGASAIAARLETKCLTPTGEVQQLRPVWMGDVRVVVSRDEAAGSVPMGAGFSYGTWARQRATKSKMSFEVWVPGHTDRDDPDLWKELDVQIHYRFDDGEFRSDYVSTAGRSGNNMRYELDLRKYDPWGSYGSANVPTTPSEDPRYQEAHMQFFFTVSGERLTPADAPFFTGTYEDYRQP